MDGENRGEAAGLPAEKPRVTVRYGSDQARPRAAGGMAPPSGDLSGGLPYALLLQMLLDKSRPEQGARDEGESAAAPAGVPSQGEPSRVAGASGGRRVRSLDAVVDDLFQISRRMQSTAIYLKALVSLLSVSPTEFADMIGDNGGRPADVPVGGLARLLQGRSKKDLSSLLSLAQSPEFMEAAAELLNRLGVREQEGETKRGQT